MGSWRRPTLPGIGGTISMGHSSRSCKSSQPRGQTVDSRDHQFLHRVFNQIYLPTAQPSGHHQTPISPLLPRTKPKAGSGHSYASIRNRRSTTQRPPKVKLAWHDPRKFTSFFLLQRKENNPFGGKVPTLGVERTPVLASGPPTKRGILGGAICACMSARRPHCHEKAAPYWFAYRSCLSCDGGRESTVV